MSKQRYVKCCICERDNEIHLFSKKAFGLNFNIVRCRNCGLAYTNPRYSIDLYEKRYFTSKGEYPGRNFLGERDLKASEKRLNEILITIEQFRKKGKILDVGCAIGTFLFLAKMKGWDVYGVEISEFATNYAREKYNLNIFNGKLRAAKFKSHFFDVITLNHILEHIDNPYRFLRYEVQPILKKNGLVVIEVPNFGSLEARIFKENFQDLRPEQHLYHFTPKSLKVLLKKASFQIIKIQTLPDQFSISSFLRSVGISVRHCAKNKDSTPRKTRIAMLTFTVLLFILSRPVVYLSNICKLSKRIRVYATTLANKK
jgi:2-polyprenyl-3-methyl-5-hydroxy-6-metoxy-1,4-benzoquinol methylase